MKKYQQLKNNRDLYKILTNNKELSYLEAVIIYGLDNEEEIHSFEFNKDYLLEQTIDTLSSMFNTNISKIFVREYKE